MSTPNDLPDEMRRRRLDGATLGRLITGRLDPDDAPPGYGQVARVLRAAAGPASLEELARAASDVAAARSLLAGGALEPSPTGRRSKVMGRKRYRSKVIGLVAAGAILGTGGLAFAGGLPDAAQDVVSDALARVGLHVPAGDDHPAATGEEISSLATTTEAEGVDKGAEISSLASGGMSQAGQHGNAGEADGDSEPAPAAGGAPSADQASGGTSEAGTDTAGEASGGRSDEGSGNASAPPDGPEVPAPSLP
jgi:hypothetical protein